MTAYDLAIVGGGISGLTAAYAAAKKKQSVVLIEPGQLGGMLQTKYVEGFQLETSAHILTAKNSLKAICAELGVTIEYPDPLTNLQAVFFDGKQASFKKTFFSIVWSGLWPLTEMLRALKNIIRPDPGFTATEDMSVTEFMTLFTGPKMTARLITPILRGVYGGLSDRQSASWIFPSLWKKMRRTTCPSTAPKGLPCRIQGGNVVLVNALVSAISGKVTISKVAATSVTRADGTLQVATTGGVIQAKAVQWTTDPEALGLQGCTYVPITVAHVSCDNLPQNLKKHLGVLFGEGSCEPLLGIMCYSELFPKVAPQGKALLTFMFGGRGALNWNATSVIQFITAELLEKFPLVNPIVLGVEAWERAIPLYPVEHERKLEAFHRLEKAFPGLKILSRQTSKPGVSDRLAQALES